MGVPLCHLCQLSSRGSCCTSHFTAFIRIVHDTLDCFARSQRLQLDNGHQGNERRIDRQSSLKCVRKCRDTLQMLPSSPILFFISPICQFSNSPTLRHCKSMKIVHYVQGTALRCTTPPHSQSDTLQQPHKQFSSHYADSQALYATLTRNLLNQQERFPSMHCTNTSLSIFFMWRVAMDSSAATRSLRIHRCCLCASLLVVSHHLPASELCLMLQL